MALHHHRDTLQARRTSYKQVDPGKRLTEQHHADACDAHKIIEKYARTGVLTHMNNLPGRYEDLPDQMDYQQALSVMERAGEAFRTVPSAIRAHYNNNPASFLAAFSDPAQRPFLTQHGFFNTAAATMTPSGTVSTESVPPQASE